MPTLKSMGVNTIRTWGTDGDVAAAARTRRRAYGIKVINGFWLNQGADYVNDTALQDQHAELDRRGGQHRTRTTRAC